MAAIAAPLRPRDVTRHATVELQITETPVDRLSWKAGMLVMRVAVWLLGFAGVTLHTPDQGGE